MTISLLEGQGEGCSRVRSYLSCSCRNLLSSLGGFLSWTDISTRVAASGRDLRTSRSRVSDLPAGKEVEAGTATEEEQKSRSLPQCVAKDPGLSTSDTGILQTSLKIRFGFLPPNSPGKGWLRSVGEASSSWRTWRGGQGFTGKQGEDRVNIKCKVSQIKQTKTLNK